MSQNDTAVKDEVVADATTTESPAVENTSPVTADNALDDDAFDDIEDEAGEAETDSDKEEADPAKPDADDTKTKDQPKDEQPTNPKSENRFRQLANDNRDLRHQIEELQAKEAQFATEQGLLTEVNPETGEYYTPQEIERISWQQSREAQAQRNSQELYQMQIQQNQTTINDEAAQITKDFTLLDPTSKDFVPEIGQQYVEALNDSLIYSLSNGQQANRSTLLANGINPETQATLIGYSTSPYKLAKLAADAYSRAKTQGETLGQANAQRATEKMLANADAPSSASNATSKDDTSDFDAAWDGA